MSWRPSLPECGKAGKARCLTWSGKLASGGGPSPGFGANGAFPLVQGHTELQGRE